MVELSDEEKQRVFQLKTVESKSYKQIQSIFKEAGREVSENQIREVVRLGVHGSTELATQMRTDTQEKRRELLGELSNILKLAKDKEELVTAIGAINTQLKALDSIDHYEGKGISPKTQFNVLIIEAEKEFRNKVYSWIMHLPKEQIDDFQRYIAEEEKTLNAKYKVIE